LSLKIYMDVAIIDVIGIEIESDIDEPIII
jgi:hypothetical protein